jgi:arsenite-transporting ATPase
MRFFSLPFITLIWLEELLKLRKQIYDKKEIVSKIKFGKREIEQDKVKARLKSLIASHVKFSDLFTADTTEVNLVLNTDRLSFSEAVRIRQKLTEIGIDIGRMVINKLKNAEPTEDIENTFNEYPITRFPLSSSELSGLESLKKYILENPVF